MIQFFTTGTTLQIFFFGGGGKKPVADTLLGLLLQSFCMPHTRNCSFRNLSS